MRLPSATVRQFLPLVTLTCVAALTTACGPNAPTAAAPAPSTAVGTPVASAAGHSTTGAPTGDPTTGGTPVTATTTSSVAHAVGSCPTRSLQAKVESSQGTAGSTYAVIDFKNLSQTACVLYGYPGVSLAGGSPVSQIGLAATRSNTGTRQSVTLAPGAVGNATLRIVDAGNFSATECQPATAAYLQIYPPDQTTPIYLAYTSPACAGHVNLLSVGSVVAGAESVPQ